MEGLEEYSEGARVYAEEEEVGARASNLRNHKGRGRRRGGMFKEAEKTSSCRGPVGLDAEE